MTREEAAANRAWLAEQETVLAKEVESEDRAISMQARQLLAIHLPAVRRWLDTVDPEGAEPIVEKPRVDATPEVATIERPALTAEQITERLTSLDAEEANLAEFAKGDGPGAEHARHHLEVRIPKMRARLEAMAAEIEKP